MSVTTKASTSRNPRPCSARMMRTSNAVMSTPARSGRPKRSLSATAEPNTSGTVHLCPHDYVQAGTNAGEGVQVDLGKRVSAAMLRPGWAGVHDRRSGLIPWPAGPRYERGLRGSAATSARQAPVGPGCAGLILPADRAGRVHRLAGAGIRSRARCLRQGRDRSVGARPGTHRSRSG